MTSTSKFWAILVFVLGLYGSVAVLFGHILGLASGIGTFERIGALIAMGIDSHGRWLTSLGILLFGFFMAMACIACGEGSPGFGASDGECGSDGDGGD